MIRQDRHHRERGQVLVLVTLALVGVLTTASLVVDGGNAFAQQRVTQNASDAAAEAGAVALAQNVASSLVGAAPSKTDRDVAAAVNAAASTNGIVSPADAWYTDVNGVDLAPSVKVGSLGAVPPPSGAYGVRVAGTKTFGTLVAGVVGISQWTAAARAVAVAGELTGFCAAPGCPLLPITFPSTISSCDGTDKTQIGSGPYAIVTGARTEENESIVPICGTGPGSVGWLAFAPEDSGCGGGKSDLVCDIETPDNAAFSFPIWVQTETGNTNNNNVDDAMNTWDNKVIYLPLYDCMKDDVGQVSPGPACPSPQPQVSGNNAFYHLIGALGFYLDHAYINGHNPQCNEEPGQPPVGGNGATGCLKGWFVIPMTQGPVGAPDFTHAPGPVGVQLIK